MQSPLFLATLKLCTKDAKQNGVWLCTFCGDVLSPTDVMMLAFLTRSVFCDYI